MIVPYLVPFINISMRKYVLSAACSSGEKMKEALLDKSYDHNHYVTSHALRLLDLQLLLLCVLLLVFHCLSILANHGNRNSQTPAALDMVDGIECFPQVNENCTSHPALVNLKSAVTL